MKYPILLLGTNLGDTFQNLKQAILLLEEYHIKPIEISSVFKTEPWGFETEHWFFNLALKMETDLPPQHLLYKILEIERVMGRVRNPNTGYEDRLIDIDILFYDSEIIHFPDLIIPHPKLHERRFVLEPLLELNQDFIHPIFNKSIGQLYKECKDLTTVIKIGSLYSVQSS